MGDYLENRGPTSPKEAKKLVKQLKKEGHTSKYVGWAYGYMLAHYPKDDRITILSVIDKNDERAIIPAYRRVIEDAFVEYGPTDLVQFFIIRLDDDHEFVCGISGV
jgi:DNA-binding IscR family transcriptional regulator